MQVNALGYNRFNSKGSSMSQHIQFTKDVGEYKAGHFTEVADMVGKQFIEMGVAKAAPDDLAQRAVAMAAAQMRALVEEQAAKQREEVQAQLKKISVPARDFARPKHVAGPDNWTDEESEVDKRRGIGNWFRAVVYATCVDVDDDSRQNARNLLLAPWSEGGYGCRRVSSMGPFEPHGQRAMQEGTGSLGGFTTPVIYENQVFAVAGEQSTIVSRAEMKPMGARQIEFPALNQYIAPSTGQSAFYGGMQIFRKGELQPRAEVDIMWKKITMLAQDLTAYTEISRDLVQDSTIPIDNYIVRMMGEAIGWREDWEAINGDGVGQFLGFLNAPALLVVQRHGVGAGLAGITYPTNIDFADILALKSRMVPGARDPIWLIHPYGIEPLAKIVGPNGQLLFIPNAYVGPGTQAIGAVGNQGHYAGGVGGEGASGTKRLAGTLLGDPVFISEKVPPPATGTANAPTSTSTYGRLGELSYVDCKSYWVGRRSGLEVGLSEHYLFKNDELAIRAKVRNDGRPGQLAPITLADGTLQVSGFVTLGAGATAIS